MVFLTWFLATLAAIWVCQKLSDKLKKNNAYYLIYMPLGAFIAYWVMYWAGFVVALVLISVTAWDISGHQVSEMLRLTGYLSAIVAVVVPIVKRRSTSADENWRKNNRDVTVPAKPVPPKTQSTNDGEVTRASTNRPKVELKFSAEPAVDPKHDTPAPERSAVRMNVEPKKQNAVAAGKTSASVDLEKKADQQERKGVTLKFSTEPAVNAKAEEEDLTPGTRPSLSVRKKMPRYGVDQIQPERNRTDKQGNGSKVVLQFAPNAGKPVVKPQVRPKPTITPLKDVERTHSKARFAKRSRSGSSETIADAKYVRGCALEAGQSFEAAADQFLEAVQLGSKLARVKVFACYLNGQGFRKDLKMAEMWRQRIEMSKDPETYLAMAEFFDSKLDYLEAAAWKRRYEELVSRGFNSEVHRLF